MSGPPIQAARGRGRGRGDGDTSSSPHGPGFKPPELHSGRAEREPSQSLSDSTERKQSPRLAGRGRARPRKPEQQLYVPRGRRQQDQGHTSKTQSQSQDSCQAQEQESPISLRHASHKATEQPSVKTSKRSASGSKKGRSEVQVYVPRARRKQDESALSDTDNMTALQSSSQDSAFTESEHPHGPAELDKYATVPLQPDVPLPVDEGMEVISSENSGDLQVFTSLEGSVESTEVSISERQPQLEDTDLSESESYPLSETADTRNLLSGQQTDTENSGSHKPPANPNTAVLISQQDSCVQNADIDKSESISKQMRYDVDMKEPTVEQSEIENVENDCRYSVSTRSESEESTQATTNSDDSASGMSDAVQSQTGANSKVTSDGAENSREASQMDTEQLCDQWSGSVSAQPEDREQEVNFDSGGLGESSSEWISSANHKSESSSNETQKNREENNTPDVRTVCSDFSASTCTIIEGNNDSKVPSVAVAELQDTAAGDSIKDVQQQQCEPDTVPKDQNVTSETVADKSTLTNKPSSETGITLQTKSDSKPSDSGDASNVAVTCAKKDRDDMEDEEEEDSWDKIFDDNGDCLDPSMVEELTQHVGDVEISRPKKTINYLDYQAKEPDMDMTAYSHVIEISNFPAEFQTRDLLVAFKDYMSRGFDIKWVDDTHALGVFSSAIAAADALKMIHPMMQLKPLTEASKQSRSKARRCQEFLQPYKPRPVTSAAAARRLVTGALGMTPRVSKEQRAEEHKVLKEAREKKKQDRKQKEAIWDGNVGKCAMDSC